MASASETTTTSTTSLKLDRDLKDRIQKLAEIKRRSAHWIMREAVERYVAIAEAEEAFNQRTLESWKHYQETGLHVTGEEMEAWLDAKEAGADLPFPKCHL